MPLSTIFQLYRSGNITFLPVEQMYLNVTPGNLNVQFTILKL